MKHIIMRGRVLDCAWESTGLRLVKVGWERLESTSQRAWIAVGKAVAEHVLQEIQTSVEASE